ncbi:rhamnose/proton symporter RhaT [Labilibaculum filiforme]|uniref:Rhamnose/proton symporter RhaT n=1 Tax=Labilibaculum filiforme TaxID=1940526 RepID=A0A2N3HSL0_9BACT|nr:L-rhamnose/proton symporter RhaT [Labilibaculum filiforme]PKQ61041.1 rhamnose/proton symporter RhaT [Labilibaculum filiforme]
MEFAFIPFVLVLFASVFQGSFGLGMKFMAPLKWEAWWLVHATVAMLIVPIVWALLVVPDLFGVIKQAPSQAIWIGMLFGFLWGIGGIMFGKSIPYIGISLTYGIVMGVCSAVGSLIPFFQLDGAINLPAFPYVMAGVLIMIVGVAITAYAGIKRDKLSKKENDGAVNLKLGLGIAIISGVLSAFLNVGFVNAQPVGEAAVASGVIARNSSLAIWVVVLIGAYLMNAGYAIILLFKNKSWSSFSVPKSGKAYVWSVGAGLLWFGALGVYGQGATLMGNMGPIIGWPILLGVSLVVSNVWAYLNKEWVGAKQAFNYLLVGLLVLIIATVVLGYSNGVV